MRKIFYYYSAACCLLYPAAVWQKWLVAGGSFLFYCTDVAVSTNVVFNTKLLLALTWICYTPALFMLSVMNYPFKHQGSVTTSPAG